MAASVPNSKYVSDTSPRAASTAANASVRVESSACRRPTRTRSL